VVVDAGHGGRDPGAIGVGGLREKDVTLALAKTLRKSLRARGFSVVLTRDRDRTLSLEERTAIAEGAGGDVFVSVHANASPRANWLARTFTLQENAERQTPARGARERCDAGRGRPLQRLLARLRLGRASALRCWRAGASRNRGGWGIVGLDASPLKQDLLCVVPLDMPALLVEGAS
jgi:N-acetylmuramoyl-L-alanine amidase